MDRSKDDPLQLDSFNFMASMTKLMTSIAVMQCVERGLVGLDDGQYARASASFRMTASVQTIWPRFDVSLPITALV